MDLQQKALFSLLLVGSFLLIDVNSECTWTRGNTCYTLVEEVQQQAQAQANCVEMYKGNLVSITSQDEDDFIRARYLDHFRNITAFVSTTYILLPNLGIFFIQITTTCFENCFKKQNYKFFLLCDSHKLILNISAWCLDWWNKY